MAAHQLPERGIPATLTTFLAHPVFDFVLPGPGHSALHRGIKTSRVFGIDDACEVFVGARAESVEIDVARSAMTDTAAQIDLPDVQAGAFDRQFLQSPAFDQGSLRILAPGDVPDQARQAHDAALRVTHRRAARQQPVHAAVRPDHPEFALVVLAAADGVVDVGQMARQIVRMHAGLGGIDRRRRLAQHGQIVADRATGALRQIPFPGHHARRVQRTPQLRLGFTQRDVRAFLFGDVPGQAGLTQRRTPGVALEASDGLDPAHVAVRADDAELGLEAIHRDGLVAPQGTHPFAILGVRQCDQLLAAFDLATEQLGIAFATGSAVQFEIPLPGVEAARVERHRAARRQAFGFDLCELARGDVPARADQSPRMLRIAADHACDHATPTRTVAGTDAIFDAAVILARHHRIQRLVEMIAVIRMHEPVAHVVEIGGMISEQLDIAHADDATARGEVVLEQVQLDRIHHHFEMPHRLQAFGFGALLVRGVELADDGAAIAAEAHDGQQEMASLAITVAEAVFVFEAPAFAAQHIGQSGADHHGMVGAALRRAIAQLAVMPSRHVIGIDPLLLAPRAIAHQDVALGIDDTDLRRQGIDHRQLCLRLGGTARDPEFGADEMAHLGAQPARVQRLTHQVPVSFGRIREQAIHRLGAVGNEQDRGRTQLGRAPQLGHHQRPAIAGGKVHDNTADRPDRQRSQRSAGVDSTFQPGIQRRERVRHRILEGGIGTEDQADGA